MATEWWAIGLVVIGTMISASAPTLFKLGSEHFTMNPIKLLKHPLRLLTNWQIILGCLLYTTAAFLFIPALRGGELSVLYPLIALSYVWSAFLSMKVLGEKMNRLKWIGISIIIFSVGLIGIGST